MLITALIIYFIGLLWEKKAKQFRHRGFVKTRENRCITFSFSSSRLRSERCQDRDSFYSLGWSLACSNPDSASQVLGLEKHQTKLFNVITFPRSIGATEASILLFQISYLCVLLFLIYHSYYSQVTFCLVFLFVFWDTLTISPGCAWTHVILLPLPFKFFVVGGWCWK